jgi:hypothetical protein
VGLSISPNAARWIPERKKPENKFITAFIPVKKTRAGELGAAFPERWYRDRIIMPVSPIYPQE